MDRQRVKGGIQKATGKIRRSYRRPASLESEGKAENAEGHVRSGVGKAMDAVREIVNSEKE